MSLPHREDNLITCQIEIAHKELGKIRTRKVKVLASEILEGYPDLVKPDFESNKALVGEVLTGAASKKLRNKVAGYLTTLMKRRLKQSVEQEPTPEPSEEVNA